MIRNTVFLDFPGGPGVKNPPANTGDTGCCRAIKPVCHNGWGHVLQFLKPTRSRPYGLQEKPLQGEALTPLESSPRSPQLEKAIMRSNADPAQPKINE